MACAVEQKGMPPLLSYLAGGNALWLSYLAGGNAPLAELSGRRECPFG